MFSSGKMFSSECGRIVLSEEEYLALCVRECLVLGVEAKKRQTVANLIA